MALSYVPKPKPKPVDDAKAIARMNKLWARGENLNAIRLATEKNIPTSKWPEGMAYHAAGAKDLL